MYHLAKANLFLSWPFSFTKSLSDSLSKPVPKYKTVTPHHLIWEMTLPTFITAIKGDIVTFLSHHLALKALQPSAVLHSCQKRLAWFLSGEKNPDKSKSRDIDACVSAGTKLAKC